jgi:hypothetical protein
MTPAFGSAPRALLALALVAPGRASAQVPDSAARGARLAATPVVAADTARHIRPMTAFWRSLALPGWGQAATGRPVPGALFATWEGVTAMMTLKAQAEVRYLKETGSSNLGAKRQEVQDWLVLWVFNHFFSGAEAFVAAHLREFPKALRVTAVPVAGGVGVGVAVPRP